MRLGILVALFLVTPLLPLALVDGSGACPVPGNVALGIVVIGSGKANSTTAYVDDRNYVQGGGIWVYLESNRWDGLQRGGSSIVVPNDQEVCTDDSPTGPDTLVL